LLMLTDNINFREPKTFEVDDRGFAWERTTNFTVLFKLKAMKIFSKATTTFTVQTLFPIFEGTQEGTIQIEMFDDVDTVVLPKLESGEGFPKYFLDRITKITNPIIFSFSSQSASEDGGLIFRTKVKQGGLNSVHISIITWQNKALSTMTTIGKTCCDAEADKSMATLASVCTIPNVVVDGVSFIMLPQYSESFTKQLQRQNQIYMKLPILGSNNNLLVLLANKKKYIDIFRYFSLPNQMEKLLMGDSTFTEQNSPQDEDDDDEDDDDVVGDDHDVADDNPTTTTTTTTTTTATAITQPNIL